MPLWPKHRELKWKLTLVCSDMDRPRDWHPTIVDIQLLRLGQFVIAAVPGEFTTMAGRRLVEGLKSESLAQGLTENSEVGQQQFSSRCL